MKVFRPYSKKLEFWHSKSSFIRFLCRNFNISFDQKVLFEQPLLGKIICFIGLILSLTGCLTYVPQVHYIEGIPSYISMETAKQTLFPRFSEEERELFLSYYFNFINREYVVKCYIPVEILLNAPDNSNETEIDFFADLTKYYKKTGDANTYQLQEGLSDSEFTDLYRTRNSIYLAVYEQMVSEDFYKPLKQLEVSEEIKVLLKKYGLFNESDIGKGGNNVDKEDI